MTFTVQENAIFTGDSTTIRNLDAQGSIANADVSATAAIAASKLIHQFPVSVELAEASTNVAAITKLIHIVNGATGTVANFDVAINAAMTGDRTVSIDLQKSTGAGAFASVLSAAISLSSSTAAKTATAGTISSASVVATDIFQIVVTLGGSTGTIAQGLVATVFFTEDPS